MSSSGDGDSDYDDDEFYGVKPAEEGVTLPNFKVQHDINVSQMLETIEKNIPPDLAYRSYVPFQRFTFAFEELELSVTVDLQKSTDPIVSRVENHGYDMRRKVIDGIRCSLRDLIRHENSIHVLPLTVYDSGIIVLRLLEHTNALLHEYRASLIKKGYWDSRDFRKMRTINNLLDQDHGFDLKGVDLDTVHGAADFILGKTPAQICEEALGDTSWRIIHCENIIRQDLATKFLQSQQHLRAKLMEESIHKLRTCVPPEHRRVRGGLQIQKEQLVDYLIKPRLTFHGTRHTTIPSIIQHGFLKAGDVHPKTGRQLPVYNGAAYGRGIYTSPKAWYALHYTEKSTRQPWELRGVKLIVCAVIMGRPATVRPGDSWWDQSEPYPGADSHTNESQFAYIVFDSARVLPCYVLHMDFADTTSEEYKAKMHRGLITGLWAPPKLRDLPVKLSAVENAQKKQQLIAKGQKFFAYGYGAVKGKELVIEDVAEVDDDEEEYGQYQKIRIDAQATTNTSVWDEDWGKERVNLEEEALDGIELEGQAMLDEYTKARKAKLNRRPPKTLAKDAW